MAQASGSSAAEICLSVEETNQLRAKLGLKPLRTEENVQKSSAGRSSGDGDRGQRESGEGRRDREKTAEEKRRETQQIRERIEDAERKRLRAALTEGPTIAEQQGDELDDPAAWLARMRRKEDREKRVLASQGKLDAVHYSDDDEEESPPRSSRSSEFNSTTFNSSSVGSNNHNRVSSTSSSSSFSSSSKSLLKSSNSSNSKNGSSTDGRSTTDDGWRGGRREGEVEGGELLRVVHDLEEIGEGEEVILTLKDTKILNVHGELNEEADALLESVSLVEQQREEKKRRMRERKALYDPTEELEGRSAVFAEDGGGFRTTAQTNAGAGAGRDILPHYDEWEQEQLEFQESHQRAAVVASSGTTSAFSAAQTKGFFLLPRSVAGETESPIPSFAALRPQQQQLSEQSQQLVGGSRVKYDASGPSSVVAGEGQKTVLLRSGGGAGGATARETEKAEEAVSFRKISKKKKISKRRTGGSAFWSELFSSEAHNASTTEAKEEGEATEEEDSATAAAPTPGAAGRSSRKDQHHASRKEAATDRRLPDRGTAQKQHVREALDAAAHGAYGSNSTTSSSNSSRSSYSHHSLNSESSSKKRERSHLGGERDESKRSGSGKLLKGGEAETPVGSEAKEGFLETDGGLLSAAVKDDDHLLLLEEDRLLNEQLERQRRLARLKLEEQQRQGLMGATKTEGLKEGVAVRSPAAAAATGAAETAVLAAAKDSTELSKAEKTEPPAGLGRKRPQERLLELLVHAKKVGAAVLDIAPTTVTEAPTNRKSTRSSPACDGPESPKTTTTTITTTTATAATGESVAAAEDVLGEKEEEDESVGLQLSTTTEFCRTVQTPLEKLQTTKQEVFAGARLFRQQKAAQKMQARLKSQKDSGSSSLGEGRLGRKRQSEPEDKIAALASRSGSLKGAAAEGDVPASGHDNEEEGEEGSTGENSARQSKGVEEEEEEDDGHLNDVAFMNETPMGQGLAEALKYLQSKNHYSLDKMRQRRHRPDEVPLHKPLGPNEIKIDHRDFHGNVMTPKDAFRHISWRFHGKYPSLNKQEKKARKMHLERKLLKNPMEALPTLNALQKLQQTEKSFHLVLTGGSLGESRGR